MVPVTAICCHISIILNVASRFFELVLLKEHVLPKKHLTRNTCLKNDRDNCLPILSEAGPVRLCIFPSVYLCICPFAWTCWYRNKSEIILNNLRNKELVRNEPENTDDCRFFTFYLILIWLESLPLLFFQNIWNPFCQEAFSELKPLQSLSWKIHCHLMTIWNKWRINVKKINTHK